MVLLRGAVQQAFVRGRGGHPFLPFEFVWGNEQGERAKASLFSRERRKPSLSLSKGAVKTKVVPSFFNFFVAVKASFEFNSWGIHAQKKQTNQQLE
jgi:hypothetical protein